MQPPLSVRSPSRIGRRMGSMNRCVPIPRVCAGLLFAALLGSSFGDASARQALIRGFVTDSTTEQSMQGATVVLRTQAGTTLGTTTDGDGYFILRRIPPGRHTLSITFIGYRPYQETLTLEANTEVQRQAALVEQEATLDEVVIRAEGEGTVTAVAAGLQTVVPAQIERVPMPGVTGDLASYMQTVPGVVVQGDRGGQFYVRGGALDQNLALIDGLPIYMPFHILSFYSAFPQEIIDNAGLYTGGFGARYGTRISSVVDVTTRNGNKQKPAGEISLAPFLSTARLEGPLIKNKVSVIASVRESFVEAVMPNLLGQRFPYRFGDRFGKVHAFLNASNSFSLTALHTRDRGDLAGSSQDFKGDAVSSAVTDSNQVAWENLVLGGRYVFLPGFAPLVAEITGGYSAMTNEFGTAEARERTSEIRSVDAAAHFTYFFRDAEIRFGATVRTSTFEFALGGLFQELETGKEDLTEASAYLESALPLMDGRLRLTPGLNVYNLPNRNKQWVEPRLRLTWLPTGSTGRQQIHAAWGLYHQAFVGLNDERDVGNIFTAWTITPRDAGLPESMHAILGWSMRIAPWVSVAAEAFYKDFSNLSVPIFSAFPRFTTALQPADGEAMGFDVRLDLRDQPFYFESVLDGYVSYALSRVAYRTEQATYHPSHDRRHQINALLHAQRGPVGMTIQWQFGTGLPFTRSAGFDVWHLLTPDVDVTRDPGQERVLYSAPFGGRQPIYQRLDAWLERAIERTHTVATLRAGALNLFNRDNLFYYDLFSLNRVNQLPFVPSVGFKLELR